ncbi:NAD(P)/FAD-dependent oxidoreductase [Flavobacterium agrisoli]|uniref:FAD-binding oxidoreductase n=1 Tax=Flavobacterium agrisoli TaxID=2793066 RepID=A0A934PMV2_9FLAO|nr:FAD-dependent oxidoreductase [Flavobacterium agrisoli]MBK0370417.1 FAD-binding oxidoreductase [Flavobacterium agrisoli]
MIDYIIVGSGLAGIAFAEEALKHQKTFVVFDNHSQNSSRIAGGLYNPVILKRFSEVWQAAEQLEVMNSFYESVEAKLLSKFNFKRPILRKFFSIEEQNNWFVASDKIGLNPFLSTKLIAKKYKGIESPFDYGEVLQTGYVDTASFLNAYRNYLKNNQFLIEEKFDYNELFFDDHGLTYKNFKAKNIIFAEGFGMMHNPFFQDLPLDGTKGELFVIKAPTLDLDVIVNTSVFILPMGNDLFKVGATYNWKDKTDLPTEEGKKELIERIQEILNCDFEIIAHFAGVRPTVKDRRPLLGTHPIHANMHLLNGLGTRGVMLAPSMAKMLYDYIENKMPLDATIDIKRIYKKRS